MLVINRLDPAPLAGADLSVMVRDSRRMRGTRPFIIFTKLKEDRGVAEIADFILASDGITGGTG
jgi:urease accessory protein